MVSERPEHDGRVLPAKTEIVAEDGPNPAGARSIRHVIQITVGIRILEIDRGRDHLSLNRLHAYDRLDATGGAEQVTGHRFGRTDRDPARVVAEDLLDRKGLKLVVVRRRGAVGVDIIDLQGRRRSTRQCPGHRHRQPLPFRIGLGDVKRVARRCIAREFAIDARPARQRVVERLQHQHAGALTHDEAVAIAVERAARLLRRIVPRAHGLHRAEARIGEGRDGGLTAACNHDVRVAPPDRVRRLAQRMGAGRTGRDEAEIGPARAILDGDQARTHVADQRGDREGRHLARPTLHEHAQLVLKRVHAADSRPDHHAHAVGILAGHVDSRIGHRLLRRHETKVRIAVVAPRFLGIHVLRRIPIEHLGANLAGELGRIELRHPLDAATTGQQAGPERINVMTDRGHDPEPRHYDPTRRGWCFHRHDRALKSLKTKRRSARNFREGNRQNAK